ncbi:MAG: MFS transporter [Rhodoferax sp.]
MTARRDALLNPGVEPREVWAWALYDFANSGYTTVVITAVFAAYFVGGVAQGASWATLAWTLALGVSNAGVMLLMPLLGAYADARACKKPLLALTTAGCVLATAALAAVGPGDVALALVLVALSNLFYALGEGLIAAFLPELARPAALGRVSGWGWGLGYVGGMLTLGLCLAYVLWAQAQGQTGAQFVPVTMGMTALMYALPASLTLAWLRERAVAQTASVGLVGLWFAAWQPLRATAAQAGRYRDFVVLLACSVAYQAGVAIAIALAAIYAEQVMGFAQQETMIMIFALNLAAAAGALGWGYVQDRVGHRLALGSTLVGWMAVCALAATSHDKAQFWVAAVIAGVCMGSSQSAGRAMAGLLAPPAQRAEFFGLWAFAVRLATIAGPLGYGVLTWATGGNQRLAIGCTTGLFVLGLVLLLPLNMERGQAAARAHDTA